MNSDSDTIDRIVAGVLNQLAAGGEDPQSGVTAEAPRRGEVAEAITLTANVVTADVLVEGMNGDSPVVVTERAVVTPAAWDAAKARGIEIVRSSSDREANDDGTPLVIVVRNTEAVERLWDDLKTTWRRELAGGSDEAAAVATSVVCRGESPTVIIVAEQSHRAACLANRNEKVKAVAIGDASDVRNIRKQLRANVWCLDPTGRSWFELRSILNSLHN